LGLTQPARRAVVDILDRCFALFELRDFQSRGQLAILAVQPLVVDEKSEELLLAQALMIDALEALLDRSRHPVELHLDELLVGLFKQHVNVLQWFYSRAKQLSVRASLLVHRVISCARCSKSVVVATAAHVRGAQMLGAAGRFRLATQRRRLHPLPEHRLDGLVARRVDSERLLAGELEPVVAMLLGQAQDAEGRAVTLLGMGL